MFIVSHLKFAQHQHNWTNVKRLLNAEISFSSQVSQDLPFLHPSETGVLNRLSKLGSDYIRFTEFIEQHTGHVHQQVGDCWTSATRAVRLMSCVVLR